jgi:hypothetical protein
MRSSEELTAYFSVDTTRTASKTGKLGGGMRREPVKPCSSDRGTLHWVTTQKAMLFMVSAFKTSNPTQYVYRWKEGRYG